MTPWQKGIHDGREAAFNQRWLELPTRPIIPKMYDLPEFQSDYVRGFEAGWQDELNFPSRGSD